MNWKLRILRKFITPIELQADEFLCWKGRIGNIKSDEEYLRIFLEICPAITIEDITERQVREFSRYILETRTPFAVNQALKALRCFFRYHRARKVDCLRPERLPVKAFGV